MCQGLLVSLIKHEAYIAEIITLPMTMGEYIEKMTKLVDFLNMDLIMSLSKGHPKFSLE